MLFVVHCLDRAGALDVRLANYEAHKAYLAATDIRTVVSGPLLAPDHETMIGSFLLVEADSEEAVRQFNANDPFARANLWESVHIHPFSKRVDNR